MAAFARLNGARTHGFAGPQPIALGEIESYCRLFGPRDPEEAAELAELVQAMDAAYLEVAARQGRDGAAAEKGQAAKARPGPGRRRR